MSRPKADYHCIFVHQVEKLCLLGMIDVEIAEFFNISVRTLNRWKKKYPEFWQSMKKGKQLADSKVAAALYKSAIGGEYIKEEKIVPTENGHEVVTIKKQIPANVTAQKFWLTNRQPKLWKHKVNAEVKVVIDETNIDHLKNLAAVMDKAHERQRLLRIERGLDN